MEAIIFKNFTNEDFVGRWNSIDYPVKAGVEMYFEAPLAKHFAEDLIDREINKRNDREGKTGKKNEISTNDESVRKEFRDRALPKGTALTPVEALNVEEKKKRKPKKVVEEFKGLKKKK